MSVIKKIQAREILDSRGNPTVETDLWLQDNSFGRAAVPSGASTGTHEAIEKRDNNLDRFNGQGVLQAIKGINQEINQVLENQDFDQKTLDEKLCALDGTPNKSHLGANATLAVSLAFAKAEAQKTKLELCEYFAKLAGQEKMLLPVPMMNILNGGKHANGSSDFQEFMIMPIGVPTFAEALRVGAGIFQTLKEILRNQGSKTTVGDEGGFAPSISTNEQALELLWAAVKQAGYEPGRDIVFAIDAAASEFYQDGQYFLKTENRSLTSEEMIEYFQAWLGKYPIVSLEDALAEDDWIGFKKLTQLSGNQIQLVGDDLFVTNPNRLQKGIEEKICNAILLKPNQIGTITETIKVAKMAKDAGYATIVSHRSGETEDTTIADLAVGLGTGQIKTGSLCRSERTAKYNQLLRLEEKFKGQISYPGKSILKN